MRRFVVLDRDGTIIVDKNYLSNPNEVELIPGAAAAIREMRRMGLGIVVISNQSGIGRGFFGRAEADRVNARMIEMLRVEGAEVDGVYLCPHAPEDECSCRKPKPELLFQAALAHGFDPAEAFVAGDKNSDVEFGRNAGATTLLVRTGYGREQESRGVKADFVVDDLGEAVEAIRGIVAV